MVRERRRLGRRRPGASRSPRLLFAGLVLATVAFGVGAVDQIGPTSGPFHRELNTSFAAMAAPLASRSTAAGASIGEILDRGPTMDRPTFFGLLDALAAASSEVADQFDTLIPPAPTPPAGAGCQSAMILRAEAARGLRSALETLLGGPTGLAGGNEATAATAMADVSVQISQADISWADCRRALILAPGGVRLPLSVWMGDPRAWTNQALGSFVGLLAGSASLTARHQLGLGALGVDPAAVSVSNGSAVIPPTTTLAVQMVLVDPGNVDEQGVVVEAAVRPTTAAAAPPPARRTVDVRAGASVAVDLPLLPVVAGTGYSLVITALGPTDGVAAPAVTIPLVVAQFPSGIVVTPSVTSARVGHPVSYRATVSAPAAASTVPSGTVTFDDGGTAVPGCVSLALARGRATCTVTYPGPGTHVVTAVYAGTTSLANSTSLPLREPVVAPAG